MGKSVLGPGRTSVPVRWQGHAPRGDRSHLCHGALVNGYPDTPFSVPLPPTTERMPSGVFGQLDVSCFWKQSEATLRFPTFSARHAVSEARVRRTRHWVRVRTAVALA